VETYSLATNPVRFTSAEALAAAAVQIETALPLAAAYPWSHPDAAKKWGRYVSARAQRESVGGMLSQTLQGMPPGQERF
jgi:hypothetical protein